MSTSQRPSVYQRVLIDLNTQCDFLLPRGAVPVANRQQVVPNIRRVMNWARVNRVPVISTIDAHRPGEPTNGFPKYCVDRLPGQKKLPFTLLPRRIVIYGDNTTDLPFDPLKRFRQLIFTKRSSDFMSNPKADRLINQVTSKYFIVFGVITERCVKAAVLGLIARQRIVGVVSDACGHWSGQDAELSLRQMEAKGAVLVTVDELLSGAADAKLMLRAARAEEPVAAAAAVDAEEEGVALSEPDSLRLTRQRVTCLDDRIAAVPANGHPAGDHAGNGHSNGHHGKNGRSSNGSSNGNGHHPAKSPVLRAALKDESENGLAGSKNHSHSDKHVSPAAHVKRAGRPRGRPSRDLI